MLPDGFHWRPVLIGRPVIPALFVGAVEVARLTERVDGAGWHAEVERQRGDWELRRSEIAPDEATGRRWIEAWARRDAERIRQEVGGYSDGLAAWTQR
jgi:hypothetical protein